MAEISDEAVTVRVAANILKYSQATVRTMIHDGKLKATRPNGRTYRILRSNIVELLTPAEQASETVIP